MRCHLEPERKDWLEISHTCPCSKKGKGKKKESEIKKKNKK
jgi:hypothetical protein